MKKLLSIILIILSINYSVFSLPVGGSAKIKLSDYFYEELDLLFLSLGKTVSRTRPYSANEAILYLKAIENDAMTDNQRRVYEKLLSQVALDSNESVFNFSTRGTINPEVYYHTNTAFRDSITYESNGKPSDEYTAKYSAFDNELANSLRRSKFMTIGLDLMIKSTGAVHFELPIENTVHTLKAFGSTNFMNNIPMVSSFTALDYEDFNFNFPYRAFISVGGEWWNMQLGRDQYDHGSGVSGNFVVDSHVPYHNALNLSVFTPRLKVDFLASFFPYPDQYEMPSASTDKTIGLDRYFDQNKDAYTGIKMLLDHRLEWIDSSRKSRLAVEEAIIYQSSKGILDLQVLNPVMFFHNLYIAGNANSILSLEWDYMFTKGLEQSIAIVIDDMNIPGERKHASEDGDEAKPDALGLQLGLKSAASLSNGFLKGTIEATFTSPALYLRDGNDGYTLNYVVAIRNQRSNHGVYDLTYLGYPYGCNNFNVLLSLEYLSIDRWSVGAELMFNAKGPVNAASRYSKKDSSGKISYPFIKYQDLISDETQYTLRTTVGGSYSLNENLDIYSSMSFYNVWHMDNNPSADFAFDFELMTGLKYTF